ncbi:MAG: cbb3-type cytochrome c oxidase subunit 3 [Pseudomonadota bacterium]
MTYDTVATVSQVTSLLMFISLFIAVIAYAFWPGNKGRFDEAQARALELNDKSEDAGNVQ